MRRARLWLGWIVTLGCVVASPSTIPAPADSSSELANRFLEQAEADRRAGVEDRATVLLGRAYAAAPTDAAFSTWVSELLRTGQRRRAAQALEQAQRQGAHPELVAKFEAQMEDEREPPPPLEQLIAQGDLAWSRDDRTAAREAWSRARIELDERGARLSLIRGHRWLSHDSLIWSGARLEIHDRGVLETDVGLLNLTARHSVAFDDEAALQQGPLTIRSAGETPQTVLEVGPANQRHRLFISKQRVELRAGDGVLRGEILLHNIHTTVFMDHEPYSAAAEIAVNVVSTTVSPDLRYFAVAGTDGSIHLRDLESGAEIELQLTHEGELPLKLGSPPPRPPIALALHADGQHLWALSTEELWRWRLSDGAQLERRKSPCSGRGPARFSPTGKYAAIGTHSGLCIWSQKHRKVHAVFSSVDPDALAFDDHDRLAILDSDQHLWLWSEDAGLRGAFDVGIRQIGPPALSRSWRRLGSDFKRSPRLRPDGRQLHWPDPTERRGWLVWDLDTQSSRSYIGAARRALNHQISDDGRIIAELEVGERIEVRDAGTGESLLSRPAPLARELALAATGTSLAWRTHDAVMSVALDQPGAPVRMIHVEHGALALALSPSGDEIAIVTSSGLLRWRPLAGERRFQVWPKEVEGSEWFNWLCYSADANHLIVSRSEALYVLSSALELEATVELLPGKEWLVTSPSGSVDGSPDAHRQLLSLVDEAGQRVVYSGSLAWDRHEVRGLLARLLAGERIEPLL